MKKVCASALICCGLLACVSAAPATAASGEWERAWGKDVDNAAGSGPEICVVAAHCQTGLDTTASGGEFNGPSGVAVDAAGNVYVVETTNNRVQKFDSNGNFVRMWGKDVASAGPNNTGTGFEICVAGVDTCKVGSSGGLGGEMSNPHSVAVDTQGNVFVSDRGNNRIEKFNSAGTFFATWGKDVVSAGPDNTGTGFEICDASLDTCKAGGLGGGPGGELFQPRGIAVDASGRVYSVDWFNDRVQKFDGNGNFLRMWGTDVAAAGPDNTGTGFEICTVAANCKFGGAGAGAAGDLHQPNGIAVDGAGDVYVTQVAFERRVQKFDSNGNFLRAWGKDVVSAGPGNTGTGPEICVAGIDACQSGAGGAALGGEFSDPVGLATDAEGSVYVSDDNHHRIQKFDSSGAFVRAWGKDVVSAGPGDTGAGFEMCVATADTCQPGSNPPPLLGGEMSAPTGLATDNGGNLYVTELIADRLQKFTADPPPETTIAPGPTTFGTPTPSFALSASDPASTFECSVDGGAFASCPPSFTTAALADGDHELRARATDAARQVDATPASRTFTVDTTAPPTAPPVETPAVDADPPETTITKQPKDKLKQGKSATYEFGADEPGSTFRCRIDGGASAPCVSPLVIRKPKKGGHSLEVTAIDAAGNADPTAATDTFKVKKKRKHRHS
jgi:hypothetical protein